MALLVSGCYFMEMLDGTIVTTAAPRIGAALHAPATEIGLVVTAYLLTLAVLIPLSGWLTRRLGNRVVFLTAIALFTGASIGCAASGSLGELVAFRVLQGAGGAMMVPVGRMMVLSKADKGDILRLTSYVVWPGLIAPVIAPLAGGLITTYASWHWIFLINAPLGVVAFALAWRLVADGREEAVPPPLDWTGMLLTGVGLGGLTYAAHLVSMPAPPVAETAAVLRRVGGAARRRLLAPAPGAAPAAQPAHAEQPHVPGHPARRHRVHAGGRVDAVPAAAAVPDPVRLVAGQVGRADRVRLRRERGDQARHHAADQPVRVPFGAGGVRARHRRVVAALGFTTASTPVAVIALLALASGITRSTGFTVYTTVGLADMPAELMRDANTFAATSMQLAAGLAIAASTVALRIGGAATGGGGGAPAAPGRGPSRSRSACSPSSRSAARPRRCGWTGGPATRPGGRATPPRRAGDVIPLFPRPLCR